MRTTTLATEERRDFADLLAGLDHDRRDFSAMMVRHLFRVDRLNSEDVERLSDCPQGLLTQISRMCAALSACHVLSRPNAS